MYLTVVAVMFMGLNVNVLVSVGGCPLKFPVRVVVIWYWLGCQVVVFMLVNCSVSVLFGFIVVWRVVWFTLCVVLVMLSVMFIANGVVLRLLASVIVMLNIGSVVSIAVVLYPLMVGWMFCIWSVSLWYVFSIMLVMFMWFWPMLFIFIEHWPVSFVFSWFSSIWIWYVAWVWFICWLWRMSTYCWPL